MSLHLIKPITKAARERVSAADPNGQRCLIENYSKNRAVHLAHAIFRDATTYEAVMESLEWNWNMAKGTLNLDTKENVFFLGASMLELYEEKRWALLPEESIVRRYFKESGLPCPREVFPNIKGETFRYYFLPLDRMEDIAIVRQTTDLPTANGFTCHVFPFNDFPVITSHVHPRFVIFHLGATMLKWTSLETRRRIAARFPWLSLIGRLHMRWKLPPAPYAIEDPTYFLGLSAGYIADDNTSEYSSGGDSICTPARRLKIYTESQLLRRRRRVRLEESFTHSEPDGAALPPVGTSDDNEDDAEESAASSLAPSGGEYGTVAAVAAAQHAVSIQQKQFVQQGSVACSNKRHSDDTEHPEGTRPATRRRLHTQPQPPVDSETECAQSKRERIASWVRKCSEEILDAQDTPLDGTDDIQGVAM